MLSLLAAVVLASQDDAKTIAMIKRADALIRGGHRREGELALFRSALAVVDPVKLAGDFEDAGAKHWTDILDEVAPVPNSPDGIHAISGYGNAVVLEVEYGVPARNAGEFTYGDALAVLWKSAGHWNVELLQSPSRFPVVEGPAYFMGNWLVAAGPGTNGENRDHPVLRLWHRSKGRWREVQTLEDDHDTYDCPFMVRNGKPDPRVFIARLRFPSPLNNMLHPRIIKRILRERWTFDGHRYIRHKGHFENTAYFSLERFLLAMRLGKYRTARRYSNEHFLQQLKRLGACSWNWPQFVWGVDDGTHFDLEYPGEGDTLPCRVTMKLAGDHWRIASVVPHSTAKED